MLKPEISVIIPTHNATKTLGLQLEALTCQDNAPEFEILICDNGSSDNLKEWLVSWRQDFPFIRYIETSEHTGAAYARNVGVSHAQAEKLAFCDADDVVSPRWLANASKVLEEHEAVTGGIVTIFNDELENLKTIDSCWKELRAKNFDAKDFFCSPTANGSLAPVLMGGNFAIRKNLYYKLKGFDVAFRSGSEDNDFSYRIRESGIQLQTCLAMSILYRIRQNKKQLFKRSYATGYSFALLCAKHNAWDQAKPYHSFTALTPIKNLAKFILKYKSSTLEEKTNLFATFTTSLGLLAGRIKYKNFIFNTKNGLGLENNHGNI